MLNNRKFLSGYAETKFIESYIEYPRDLSEIKSILSLCLNRNLTACFKGAGLSYADLITNNNNVVIDLRNLNKIISWNPINGEVIVEGGVTFAQILSKTLKDNWTLTSCPGSFDITIGGAISNNVHGKDSYVNGNFGEQVIEIGLMLADGKIITLNKTQNRELFNGVIGGLGLLGLITYAKLKLKKIPSPFVLSKTHVSKNIHEIIDKIELLKNNNEFIVSWIDAFSKNASIGRGFINTANWVESSDLKDDIFNRSLVKSNKVFGLFPSHLTWKILKPFFNSTNVKKYNTLLYNYQNLKSKILPNEKKELFTIYNFIHNKLPDLKEVYKPHGFLEFQPLLPFENIRQNLKKILKLCQSFSSESLLAGLKVHKSDETLLSYQLDGYSIGIDLDVKSRKKEDLKSFSKDLFDLTSDCGGKIYLAKDEYLDCKYFNIMYPSLKKFLKMKKTYDPDNLFSSDIFVRLFK